MTALPAVQPAPRATLVTLAWVETRRYVSRPIFLLALALTTYTIYHLTRTPVIDVNEVPAYPASFIGGLGMVAAAWLAQSTGRSAETLDVTPTPARVRTTALCLAAVIPFACGVLSLVAIVAFRHVEGDWAYGAFDTPDRAAILVSQVVMPAVGGPLLGIALGRWVSAAWVAPALFLIIVGWILVADGLAVTYLTSIPALYMRMFAPFTFFTSSDQGGVWSWRGSPMAFLGWQLCLCGLAVAVALLRDADSLLRRRLITAVVVFGLLAAACYALAVTGGYQHPLLTYPSGLQA